MRMILELYRKCRRTLCLACLALHRRNFLKSVNGGVGLHLEGKIKLVYGSNLTLGRNVHIGGDAYINCKGGVSIGDYSILSRRVTIYSYDHNFKKPQSLPYDGGVVLKPVRIGRYVWIGMNVTIAPGTEIGDGVVVGMGTVVSGKIPENAIVVGNRPRIIGYRDEDHTKSLVDEGRFGEVSED